MDTSSDAAIQAAKKARKAFLISKWEAKFYADCIRSELDAVSALIEAGMGNGAPDTLNDEREALTGFLRELEERWGV